MKDRILLFSRAANDPIGLSQFARLTAASLEFRPDLILKSQRRKGAVHDELFCGCPPWNGSLNNETRSKALYQHETSSSLLQVSDFASLIASGFQCDFIGSRFSSEYGGGWEGIYLS
jgi:hypothetical protein